MDSKYFDLFRIEDNLTDAIRTEQPEVTYIFNGCDGIVFVRGCAQLHWYGISYREFRLQQVPKRLRQYLGNYGIVKKGLAKVYGFFRKRGMLLRK